MHLFFLKFANPNQPYKPVIIARDMFCHHHYQRLVRSWGICCCHATPLIIPPTHRSCWGVYWFHSVRPSVCPSVRPASRVRSVASTVQDGFFPYLVQMINSMRGSVAFDDPWPWPISSRSFGLDLENHVRSVASTVLDGFFLYLAQMITIIGGCVVCYVFFQNLEIWIFGNF